MLFIVHAYILFSALSLDLFITSLLWLSCIFSIRFFKKKTFFTFFFFFLLTPVSLVEWNYRADDFNSKSQNKEYTLLNIAGVYNLTAIMSSVGAICGYPETGFEMMYFSLPKPLKKEEITFESDFAMKSSKVRGYIKSHEKSKRSVSSYPLNWTRSEHSTDSSRVALALNGASRLTVKTKKDESGNVYYECTIKTNFHMNDIGTKIKIGGVTILRLEEGVWSGMQKIGAFSPYKINRTWTVTKDQIEKDNSFFWIDDIIQGITQATI